MKLRIQLRSDSAFGRGDGVTGLVNSEVEHDAVSGFPFIKGRTIKGLLVESCADILYALTIQNNPVLKSFEDSARNMFGVPGSRLADTGCLHIGNAELADDLRLHLASKKYSFQQVIQAFTTLRHQTAVDPSTDTPKDGSLRTTRVLLRETVLYSHIFSSNLSETDEVLLAACAAGIKRGGQHRTRGLGWLKVDLIDVSDQALSEFIRLIGGAK